MDAVEILKAELAKDEQELGAVSDQLDELSDRKVLLEKNVTSLRWLISTKAITGGAVRPAARPTAHAATQQSLFDSEKSAREVFQGIITTRFSGQTFKEADIRNAATEGGFRVRGKEMSKPYARQVFGLLQEAGVIERTEEQGTYRTKAQILSDRLDKAMGAK